MASVGVGVRLWMQRERKKETREVGERNREMELILFVRDNEEKLKLN